MESSYKSRDIDYAQVLETLIMLTNPIRIIEFGILNGYSLKIFAENVSKQSSITAYDIFDEFNGNSASTDIIDTFVEYPNVNIEYGDFYTKYIDIEDSSVDILHIDIANNGDIYRFAVDKYIPKLRDRGIMILEGGSFERDEVSWMAKYHKPRIQTALNDIKQSYSVQTLGIVPSITIIKKCLYIRSLEPGDLDRGFMGLINYFTINPNAVIREKFEKYCKLIVAQNGVIYVAEKNGEVIGTGKLLLEYKLHNNLAIMGHIEDVVVSTDHKGCGVGKLIVQTLVDLAKKKGAYKVVLNCSKDIVSFYRKCNLIEKGTEMCVYLK